MASGVLAAVRLKLRYKNAIADALADLGWPEEIWRMFAGFQQYLDAGDGPLKKTEQQIRKRRGQEGAVDDVEDADQAGGEHAFPGFTGA